MDKVTKARQRIRDIGIRRSVFYYIFVIVERVFGLHVHYVFSANSFLDDAKVEVPEGYEHRLLEPADLIPYVADTAELSEEFLRGAQARQDICAATFLKGKVVSFGFRTLKRAPVTKQLDVVVPTGFRYSYKAWTHPDHRGKHLSRSRAKLSRSSQYPSLSYIKVNNYPSLLNPYRFPTSRRLRMGYVGWWEFAGKQYPFATRRAKWIGFEFVKKDEVVNRRYI